jgi:uncharacterized repeat protein (TIGR02543 family)
MKIRHPAFLIVSIPLLIALLAILPAAAADGATVSINGGSPINLIQGATQTNVPVSISNLPSFDTGNGVGLFSLTITWNRAIISIESINAASLGGNWSPVIGVPDNIAGTVTLAGFASSGFLTANTTLATMTIKGLAGGSTTFNLAIDLGDKNGVKIAANPQVCTVTVAGAGAPAPAPSPTLTSTPAPTTTPTATTTTKYTLTVNINGKGSVNPASGSTHNAGAAISLAASPDSGWRFAGWSGDLSGTSSPANLTMNSNKTVTANFTQVSGSTYNLVVALNGAGSSNPRESLEPYKHPSGATVSLTATPNPGWKFVSWVGEVTAPNSASTTVVMNGDKYVVANFLQEAGPSRFNVKVTTDGDGDTDPPPGPHNYDAGQSVVLKATPGPGWKFSQWKGSGIANPTAASTSVFINSEKTIEAVFVRSGAQTAATPTPGAQSGSKPAGNGPLGLEIWQFLLVVIGGLGVLTGLGILLKRVISNAMYRV